MVIDPFLADKDILTAMVPIHLEKAVSVVVQTCQYQNLEHCDRDNGKFEHFAAHIVRNGLRTIML